MLVKLGKDIGPPVTTDCAPGKESNNPLLVLLVIYQQKMTYEDKQPLTRRSKWELSIEDDIPKALSPRALLINYSIDLRCLLEFCVLLT